MYSNQDFDMKRSKDFQNEIKTAIIKFSFKES